MSLGCHWGITGASLGYRWGITVVSLGYHWGVTGHSRLWEKAPEKNPQNDAFLHPACKAKVSSRLDGSTVFTVSPEPLLAPILNPFWHPFGCQFWHLLELWGSFVLHKCYISVTYMLHKCYISVT